MKLRQDGELETHAHPSRGSSATKGAADFKIMGIN